MRRSINANRLSERGSVVNALSALADEKKRVSSQVKRARGQRKTALKERLATLIEMQKELRARAKELSFSIREGEIDLTDLRKQGLEAAGETAGSDLGSQGPSLAEQFASFNSSRFDLLRSFGGNTASIPTSVMATAAAPAAGGGKGAPTIVNNYTTAPPDPAAWNKQMELQIKAAA
jgi:hypothetical protein